MPMNEVRSLNNSFIWNSLICAK